MNPLLRRAASILVLLALCGCAGQGYGTKQTVGTLAGAGLGGLAGATIVSGKGRLAATAAGTLLGAFLGNAAGTSLDRADEVYARADTGSLESRRATPWRDPDLTGPTGTYAAAGSLAARSGRSPGPVTRRRTCMSRPAGMPTAGGRW